MIILIYINILLRVLILESGFVNVKRTADSISGDNPSEEDVAAEEDVEDMTNTKEKIKDLIDRGIIGRIDNKLPVSTKDFKVYQDIKEEFSSFFDEDEEEAHKNTGTESLEQIAEYLEDEIKASTKDPKQENLSEDTSKKAKSEDTESTGKGRDYAEDYPTEMPPFWDDGD